MNDSKNKKITVIITSIIIVLILVLAISYAFFSTQLSGSDQVVKVGELELVLNETSEGINLDNAIGLSDSDGMQLTPSTFELKNNGNKAVDYIIYLDDNTISDTDTRIDDKYLKYNLNKNGEDSGATLLTSIGSNPNRVLDSGTIEGGGTNTYSLNLWITSDVDGNYSGQVFSGKLRVEVYQERDKSVASVLLRNLPEENINTNDESQTFITGEDPNNYIWYSGKLWRAVSIDPSDNSVKLVTEWNISTIPYDDDSSAFEGSHMEMWLNDTTVDGFLGNLREPKKFIKMDSKWNASKMSDASKPPSENEGGTIVEDPVGLLSYYEYVKSCSGTTTVDGYLNNNLYWVALTPVDDANIRVFDGKDTNKSVTVSFASGVRPSINLKPSIRIVDGNGTVNNPYRLEGDNDADLSGTLLSSRYSGEYIRFGTGDNNLYRIVSHETEGLTKITSAEPLRENGQFKNVAFSDNGDINYSATTTIGTFLNGEYLDNSNYLTTEEINMIEDNTIWYIGHVESGENYKLSKYTTVDMASTTNSTTTRVGLLRLGELMAGQFSLKDNNFRRYYTLTPFNSTNIRSIAEEGHSGYNLTAKYQLGIKPTFNLKSNVIITSGDGTLQNPFQITLQ